MADVRSLLQKERDARRVSHPDLTYTKSGALLCNICNLNIRSESLWEGHQRSANHRKNLQASKGQSRPVNGTQGKKRKLDDVLTAEDDIRKRTRAIIDDQLGAAPERSRKHEEHDPSAASPAKQGRLSELEQNGTMTMDVTVVDGQSATGHTSQQSSKDLDSQRVIETAPAPPPIPAASEGVDIAVDEDEWAAFNRDVVAPTHSLQPKAPPRLPPSTDAKTNAYSSATISAPAVSAVELAQQQAANEEAEKRAKRRDRDAEMEDEKEDERRRMEEEFEVMEVMEEKVRRLKDLREKIRLKAKADGSGGAAGHVEIEIEAEEATRSEPGGEGHGEASAEEESDQSEDEDDVDDWFL